MIKIEHNVETGKITEIPLSEDELAERQAAETAAEAARAAEAPAKATAEAARQAVETKLAALGLTSDDLKVLGL
jgi:hypothetical protein